MTLASMNKSGKRFAWLEQNPGKAIMVTTVICIITFDLILAPFFSRDRCYVKNIYYHHGLTPNFHGTMRESIPYVIRTNSLGFKDKARRTISLKTDKYRMVFCGDSFTEGIYYSYDKTFVGIIDDCLEKNGYEILNAAVVSYCPKIHYFKVKYLIENVGLRFQELVIFADISDIQDEVAYKNFVPGGSSFVSISYFIYNTIKRYSFIGNLILTSKTAIHYLKQVESLYYSYIGSKKTGVSSTTNKGGYSGAWENWEQYDKERDAWLFDETNFTRWGKEGMELAERNMDNLLRLCRQYDIKLTIAAYPWPSEIRKSRQASKNMRFWQQYCQTREIDFLNLYPLFQGGENPEAMIAKYYIPGDIHFNADGHELVAKTWLEYFRARQQKTDQEPLAAGQIPPP